MRKILITVSLLSVTVAISARATLITYLGFEDSGVATSWRSTSVTKTYDIGDPKDNAYGTDGYVAFLTGAGYPTPGANATIQNPSYATVTANPMDFSFNGVSEDNPTLAIASSVADTTVLFGSRLDSWLGGPPGTYLFQTFTFTSDPGYVRYGVEVPYFQGPTQLYLASGGVTNSVAGIPQQATGARFYFWQLENIQVGDQVSLLFQDTSNRGAFQPGLMATTFDSMVPEPSTVLLLACGGLILWRKRCRS